MNNKGQFIVDLLTQKKLTLEDRERILKLSAREFENIDNEILKKIDGLKELIVNEKEILASKFDNLLKKEEFHLKFKELELIIKENSKSNKKARKTDILIDPSNGVKYPKYHNPAKTASLLYYFTDNNKSLKYSTHSWEEGKFINFDDFMSKIRYEWDEIKNLIKEQNQRLHAKISNFLFNSSLGLKDSNGDIFSWGEKRLKFGWSSPALKTHMYKDGVSPFSCEIPIEIKRLDRKNDFNFFKNYSEAFKNEIECREDSKNLMSIIIELWERELGYADFNITGIDCLEGFSFFTDVQCLKEVLIKIFNGFQTRKSYSEIKIDRTSHFKNGGYHILKITQNDSFSKRMIEDGKFSDPSGDLFDIIKSLNNLADYSIENKFGDGKFYRINYLSSTEVSFIEEIKTNKPTGFTHIFKFYLNDKNIIN
jgi:hypothetical protein